MTQPLEVGDRAKHLVADCLVWDNLLPWVPSYNIDRIDNILPRFRAAGVNFASLTVGFRPAQLESTETLLARIAQVRREIEDRAEWITFAGTVDEIRAAQAKGKIAVNFNFQETLPFGTTIDLVALYYDLGVRQALLAYNLKNLVGDGCGERTDAGLSHFGVTLIKEMNRVGMLVDGSHTGYRSSMDAMEVCTGPFIFSHSNPHAVFAHFRNVHDDQIKACAATGGVIGVVGAGAFVGDHAASTEAIFRCLDYLVQTVGPKHVGLGLDYVADADGALRERQKSPTAWPNTVRYEYAGADQIVELTQMMINGGYGDMAIRDILGENWSRVASAVWR